MDHGGVNRNVGPSEWMRARALGSLGEEVYFEVKENRLARKRL